MLNLSPKILEDGRDTLIQHGYSDFFPVPPEIDAVINGWAKLLPFLRQIDLTKYKPYRPLFSYAPKSKVNLRPVTLLHPVDAILYFALVRDLRDGIEAQRVPKSKNVVFSFRAGGADEDELYSPHPSHAEFQDEQVKRAQARPNGFVASADIAEFYPRLYQHRVRNALSTCTSSGNEGYPAVLERMLRRVSADRTSYGIPIGPAASRPLAEAALIDVDDVLTSFDIEFIRYIDDFHLFAATREEAEWNLRKLGEVLNANHGLSLQSAKTKIQTSAEFLLHVSKHKDVGDKVDAAFDKLVEDHFYEIETLDELSVEEKETLDSLDLGKILEDALDEEEINYKKVAFILDKLSSLERPDLIDIVLANLARLYPVAHAIHAFFLDLDSLDADVRNKAADALLAPINAPGKARAPEFYSIWILDLFREVPVWNHKTKILQIFRETQSQAVKRYAALALSTVGGRAEAVALKEMIHAAEPMTRLALIIASKKLGKDERKYWLQELDLDPFEALVVEHC